MKITKIEIKDFYQFKNFTIDLTYPKGHEKEGKPLEKICFIGQSGTGKTTLLNLLKESLNEKDISPPIEENELKEKFTIICKLTSIINNGKVIKKYFYKSLDNDVYSGVNVWHLTKGYTPKERSDVYKNYSSTKGIDFIFYPAGLIEKASNFYNKKPLRNPLDYLSTNEDIIKKIEKRKSELKNKKSFDFEKDNPVDIWEIIMSEASDYMVKSLNKSQQFSRQFTRAILKNNTRIQELTNDLEKWHHENPSPFKKTANLLNPIINKFNLEVTITPDFEKAEDLYFVKINTFQKDGKNIPFAVWSTGTKQIIFSLLPLLELNTTNSMVLVDEPERSLFPDVQRTIISKYTNLAPKAQLFFATHSPIIAAQFEPCERFILDFDDEGFIKVRNGIAPIGIHPNKILTLDYETELLTEEGNKKWKRFNELEELIEFEEDSDKKKEMEKEYNEIAGKYYFV